MRLSSYFLESTVESAVCHSCEGSLVVVSLRKERGEGVSSGIGQQGIRRRIR